MSLKGWRRTACLRRFLQRRARHRNRSSRVGIALSASLRGGLCRRPRPALAWDRCDAHRRRDISRSYQSHPPEIANANRTSAPNESAGINIIKNHHRMTIVLELIISLGGAAKQLSETLELTEQLFCRRTS